MKEYDGWGIKYRGRVSIYHIFRSRELAVVAFNRNKFDKRAHKIVKVKIQEVE